MLLMLLKFAGDRSAAPTVTPKRSSRKTTSCSRLSESRMPLSRSGARSVSGSRAGSRTSSLLMKSLMRSAASAPPAERIWRPGCRLWPGTSRWAAQNEKSTTAPYPLAIRLPGPRCRRDCPTTRSCRRGATQQLPRNVVQISSESAHKLSEAAQASRHVSPLAQIPAARSCKTALSAHGSRKHR